MHLVVLFGHFTVQWLNLVFIEHFKLRDVHDQLISETSGRRNRVAVDADFSEAVFGAEMNQHFQRRFRTEDVIMKEANGLQRSQFLDRINDLNFVSIQEQLFQQIQLVNRWYVNDQVKWQIQLSDRGQLADAKYVFD